MTQDDLTATLHRHLANFTPRQRLQAAQLIADERITAAERAATFLVWQNRDGEWTAVYITTADTCTCPAGQHGTRCYHRAAAIALNTTRRAA